MESASGLQSTTLRSRPWRAVSELPGGAGTTTAAAAATPLDLTIAALYLGLVTFLLAVIGRVHLREQNPWSIGDWLINYRGGFVRRGLPGELLWRCSGVLHASPAALVLVLQGVLYGVLLFCTWRLVRHSSCGLWVKAFLVSPATIAFPILDVQGGFRKEILLLAALALLAVLLQRRLLSPAAIGWYAATATAILVLSHEAMVFYLPYWFAVVAVSLHSVKRAARILLPAALLAGAGWVAVVNHAGDAGVAQRVCASLGPGNGGYCSGAIAALAQTRQQAHAQVAQVVVQCRPVTRYAALGVASLVPAAFPLVSLARHRQTRWHFRVVAACTLLSLALSGVLFLYALDWGRWIAIHAFCLFLVLLLVEDRVRGLRLPASTGSSWWWYVPLLIFATTWSLPRMPGPSPVRDGYMGYLHFYRP